ncbi:MULTISPECIES: hypothetical protein [Streptomyces]|uniref:hypothetical protein n=1 Tax=Streptomyces TaxID=1883 RepID=UPI001315FA45|nr:MULTISPECIES: hypothetical protein [Streptomyces]QGZ51855.1 hypothetical protein GPZ77_28855 [Streptomyces sp. QHH-9511]GGT95696.1 hypothetical protein GCM10010272_45560 [Streptomyces lateritius]
MYAELRERASELARVLWREHTVYRERGGGVVIRGEHVGRWISLAPTGGKDQARVRAGRLLDGGTTAPARSEAVVDLTAGTNELAAVCRRLLADVAAAESAPVGGPRPARASKPSKPARAAKPAKPARRRHTSLGSWVVLLCVAGIVGLWAYSVLGVYTP